MKSGNPCRETTHCHTTESVTVSKAAKFKRVYASWMGNGPAYRAEKSVAFFQQYAVDGSTEDTAGKRHHPEQPQLLQRPAALKQRNRGAARRVNRGVSDRNTDQMNQGERQANGQRGKTGRCLFIRDPQNNNQEER